MDHTGTGSSRIDNYCAIIKFEQLKQVQMPHSVCTYDTTGMNRRTIQSALEKLRLSIYAAKSLLFYPFSNGRTLQLTASLHFA